MLGTDSRFSLYKHSVCPRTTAHTGFHERSHAFYKHNICIRGMSNVRDFFFFCLKVPFTFPSICITLQSNDPSLTTRLLPRSWYGGPFFFVPSMLYRNENMLIIGIRQSEKNVHIKAIIIVLQHHAVMLGCYHYNTNCNIFPINL